MYIPFNFFIIFINTFFYSGRFFSQCDRINQKIQNLKNLRLSALHLFVSIQRQTPITHVTTIPLELNPYAFSTVLILNHNTPSSLILIPNTKHQHTRHASHSNSPSIRVPQPLQTRHLTHRPRVIHARTKLYPRALHSKNNDVSHDGPTYLYRPPRVIQPTGFSPRISPPWSTWLRRSFIHTRVLFNTAILTNRHVPLSLSPPLML